jgi:glyoxylase-like metal-dependent hydrolase (beta-lactamase superfamily II)
VKFGDFEIQSFVSERFRLDGGSMFGVIPKSMWQKLLPADENNLILMVNNLFVLTAHGKRFVFDVGLGDTLTDREKRLYGTDGVSHIESGLVSIGLTPANIDYLLLTHLHTDHCGGAVRKVDGTYMPRFPNARVVVSEREWRVAISPDERTSAVYIPERLRALDEAGLVDLIEGDRYQLFPGITLCHTGGHSEGHYGIEMESRGVKVWYYADILPSQYHLRVPFIPATDIYPLETMAVKRRLVPRILEEQAIIAFDHETQFALAKVTEIDGKLKCEPAVSTPAAVH